MPHSRRLVSAAAGAAFVAALLLVASPCAALVRVYSFQDLVLRSRLIVTGEVTGIRSYRGNLAGAGEVFLTDVTLRVDRTLKGDAGGSEVTIQVLGGEIDGAWQKCPEAPTYRQGERVLVFLRDYNEATWNTGWFQGKYALDTGGTAVSGAEGSPIPRDTTVDVVHSAVRTVLRTQSAAGGAR